MKKDDSEQENDRLAGNVPQMDWRKMLAEVHESLRIELAGRILPDPVEMLRQAREERDFQIFMALGNELLRPIASQHGLNWDEMSEEERE